MTLDDMPLFAMLKSRLGYLSDRQRLIAENVANSDTPNYISRDLKPFKVTQPGLDGAAQGGTAGPGPVTLSVTSGMHLAAAGGTPGSDWRPEGSPDSESTLTGNSVVLEEEMMKMSESRTAYQAAVSFYERSLSMLQMAAKRPGQ
ncbi:MAG: flagellar basal body rod protein FlgB [Caulobacteraceae bacterium]|nr:flagellar basal body rod protein FlgB [Caulobacteraceae bacterium]